MEIACCYRLRPNGEVIHSVYDPGNQSVAGLPEKWFDVKLLLLPEYSLNSYINCKARFNEACETILLSNKDFALVIEDNNIGYYILQFDGTKRFLMSATDGKESTTDCYIPNHELFKSVGYRRTRQIQVRSSSGVYRLVMEKSTGLFYTADGVLQPTFDVNRLGPLDYHYAGYKQMIANGAYAVIYFDGIPTFLEKTVDNKLVVVESD